MGVIWFLIGFFVGSQVGIMVFALIAAHGYSEEDENGKDEEHSDLCG